MNLGARRVRIIAIPPGEAPPWVREQWVGLELPLAQRSRAARSRRVFGVLSGPRSLFDWWLAILRVRAGRESGYAVRVLDAIALLERKSPEAAAWWRTNVPHMTNPLRCFLFAAANGIKSVSQMGSVLKSCTICTAVAGLPNPSGNPRFQS